AKRGMVPRSVTAARRASGVLPTIATNPVLNNPRALFTRPDFIMRPSGGSLLRWAITWPIPPHYSGRIVVLLLLTVSGIAIAVPHSLRGVMAVAVLAAVLTFAVPAIYARVRKPGLSPSA